MSLVWKPLGPGPFKRSVAAAGADPMWIWADATGYRDLGAAGGEQPLKLWCVVEREGGIRSELHTPGDGAALDDAELAMPVIPQRMPRPRPFVGAPKAGRVQRSSRKRVLVGVIDDGCPFAATMLRRADGKGTRVLGLWDQDEAPAFERGGFLPAGCGYGRAIGRTGLDGLMRQARLPEGTIDEDRCYRLAGYRQVRTRMGHGAAVISHLLGKPIYGGTLQPRPGEAPYWDPPNPAIDQADLVFVQLPRAGVQDSTSGALARYVVDGLRYILAHAVRGQGVVVNISSGTSRNGHDGSSLIERALAEAIQHAEKRGIDLRIVLPMGNGNLEQRHAVLSTAESHLELFLPPGCEMAQYVTVRWPQGQAGVHLRLTPPDGKPQVVKQGQALGGYTAQGACCGVVSPPAAAGACARSLLSFAPTHTDSPATPRAPSGRWRIELQFDGAASPLPEPVQFWISRNQRNPGALPRSRQADFIDWDRRHQPGLWLRVTEDDPAGGSIGDGIARVGALTGLATARRNSARVLTVGSAIVRGRPDEVSPYSAASTAELAQPDLSAPGDDSRALPGLSVRGNRGGEVVRVLGTSFAAPLAARALINGRCPKPKPKPGAQPPRVGRINLVRRP